MRIEHVAIYVSDLYRMKEFYETYFQAISNDGYHNQITGFQSFFLSFADGARLEIMFRPDYQAPSLKVPEMGYAHIAFSVGSREAVDILTKQLKEAGYEVISGPRTTGDGYYESCILDPERNMVEITQ